MIHEDKLIKIVFVKTVDNLSDSFTENVNGETHSRHSESFVLDCDDLDNEVDKDIPGRVSQD